MMRFYLSAAEALQQRLRRYRRGRGIETHPLAREPDFLYDEKRL